MEILKVIGVFVVFFVLAYVVYYFVVTNNQIRSIRGKSKKKRELSPELLFLKKYYDTFGRFDIQLLKTACKNPGEALDYIADIIDTTSIVSNFDLYQERLLQMRTDFEKIEDVHKLEQRLYSREITLEQFDEEFKTIMGRIQWNQI